MLSKPNASRQPAAAAGVMVVVRFANGRVLKGRTQDFAPNKDRFHVFPAADPSTGVEVQVADLKAVFYVKSYAGNKDHDENYDFDRVSGHGRKATVVFNDGELIAGYVIGYHPERQGFFLCPAEDASNNARIYVVNSAMKRIDWE